MPAGMTMQREEVKARRSRKNPFVTPRSTIRSALRKLFLRSREHSAVLKRDGYTCCRCGAKQSRAKGREVYVEVHHRNGVTNWEELFAAVYEFLLCKPEEMITLCKACHDKEGE